MNVNVMSPDQKDALSAAIAAIQGENFTLRPRAMLTLASAVCKDWRTYHRAVPWWRRWRLTTDDRRVRMNSAAMLLLDRARAYYAGMDL